MMWNSWYDLTGAKHSLNSGDYCGAQMKPPPLLPSWLRKSLLPSWLSSHHNTVLKPFEAYFLASQIEDQRLNQKTNTYKE